MRFSLYSCVCVCVLADGAASTEPSKQSVRDPRARCTRALSHCATNVTLLTLGERQKERCEASVTQCHLCVRACLCVCVRVGFRRRAGVHVEVRVYLWRRKVTLVSDVAHGKWRFLAAAPSTLRFPRRPEKTFETKDASRTQKKKGKRKPDTAPKRSPAATAFYIYACEHACRHMRARGRRGGEARGRLGGHQRPGLGNSLW